MLILHIDDDDLMSVEEQVSRLEHQQDDALRAAGLEKMRNLLKREYVRNVIDSYEYIEYARRLKKLAIPDFKQ